jgi:hypothetical protein
MPQFPWFIYVMLGIMLVSFFLIKVLPTIRKAKHMFSKGYKENPAASLSEEQQQAINVGAVNAEQTGFYTNSLTTGQHKEDLKSGLAEWWGITDRESAMDTISWLLNEGHRAYYEKLRPLLKEVPASQKAKRMAMLSQLFEDTDKAGDFLHHLEETEEQLKKEGFVTNEADWELGILGWDTGRAVNVIRMSYDAGYIGETVAWDTIAYAAKLTYDRLNSWKELGKSYAIGRAMWSGKGMTLDGILSIIKGLEKDAESPWVLTPYAGSYVS